MSNKTSDWWYSWQKGYFFKLFSQGVNLESIKKCNECLEMVTCLFAALKLLLSLGHCVSVGPTVDSVLHTSVFTAKSRCPGSETAIKTCWFPDFNLSCQKVINAAPWELPVLWYCVLWYFLYYIWSYFTGDFSISHFLLKVFTCSVFYILQCKTKTKTKKQKAKRKMSE